MIQFQRMQAEEGDTEAMMNMGQLHYYGARGLDRDHPQVCEEVPATAKPACCR